MDNRRGNSRGGVDNFRLAAAFMVIAIHTGPLSSWSQTADQLLVYCLGRVAVPFFLMATGYFVLAPYVHSAGREKTALKKYYRKNILLYGFATLLYAPLAVYSGNVPHGGLELIRVLLFDGTFRRRESSPSRFLASGSTPMRRQNP